MVASYANTNHNFSLISIMFINPIIKQRIVYTLIYKFSFYISDNYKSEFSRHTFGQRSARSCCHLTNMEVLYFECDNRNVCVSCNWDTIKYAKQIKYININYNMLGIFSHLNANRSCGLWKLHLNPSSRGWKRTSTGQAVEVEKQPRPCGLHFLGLNLKKHY